MRLWHRLKALRPSKTTVGATWAQLWQHIVRQVIRSRPKSPISLDSPRKAGIRKPKSPGAKTASRGPKNVRPRRPLTARDYIGLFNPILADSERLEAANRILSASKIPLELRCRAKRNVDVYSRSLQAKLNHVVRTASLGQVKDPATVLPDSTYEKVQQYRDVIVAFIRSNLHDLDPHHELIITQSRLEQGSRRLSTHKPPTTNAFIDMLSRKETSLQQEQLKAAVYRVALMTCRRNLEKASRMALSSVRRMSNWANWTKILHCGRGGAKPKGTWRRQRTPLSSTRVAMPILLPGPKKLPPPGIKEWPGHRLSPSGTRG